VALPWDREPADYLISVETRENLDDLVDPDQTRLVIRDRRVAYVENDKAFYGYDAQIPGWVRVGAGANAVTTEEGGLAIRLINDTGGASAKGSVVDSSSSVEAGVSLEGAGGLDPIGVIYDDGVANGDWVWVVVSGIADVLLEDGTASGYGNWVETSGTTAGRADATNVAPPASGVINEIQEHFREIGHCLESQGAGTNVLARCVLHFN
jgi:hypothetical protein